MKAVCAVLVAWAAAVAGVSASATTTAADSREWRFDVSLDGRRIGEHRYVLRETADVRELTSEARFNVRFLFIDAYRYEHRAQESWRGDCLERIDARTDANGKRVSVGGERDGGTFRITANDKATALDACVQTFAYWNPRILDARRLLNPQTGEYVYVEVTPMGRDLIAGRQAERFRLLSRGSSPLEIDLWYTQDLDWIALESRTPEGRRLRYERK